MNKRGTVTLYIVFMITALVIVLIASVLAPMGVLFTSEMTAAGENILERSNASIEGIANTEIRDSARGVIQSAYDNADNNIEVNSFIFRYGWVFAVIASALVLFLITRALTAFNTRSGFQ